VSEAIMKQTQHTRDKRSQSEIIITRIKESQGNFPLCTNSKLARVVYGLHVVLKPGLVFLSTTSKAILRNVTAQIYQGADKSLSCLTSRCILFDGENISFDASLVIYTNSTNIPPIMIIERE
jgi:hypothetical protein